MVEKKSFIYPGTTHSFDCYSGSLGGRNIVVFVKSHCATTLDKICYSAHTYFEKTSALNYEFFGLDKTETSRSNMFYRFDVDKGTQQTVADEDTRKFIEEFVER